MDSQGQQKCQVCTNPPDQNMVACIKCQQSYHKSCGNVTANQNSELNFECQSCMPPPAGRKSQSEKSTSTRTSNRSRKSQNRLLEMELQRLEEERAVSMEFISRKYKLLQLQEEERQSDDASSQSRSVREWLDNLPNRSHSSNRDDSNSRAPPENQNINNKNTESQTNFALDRTCSRDIECSRAVNEATRHLNNLHNRPTIRYETTNTVPVASCNLVSDTTTFGAGPPQRLQHFSSFSQPHVAPNALAATLTVPVASSNAAGDATAFGSVPPQRPQNSSSVSQPQVAPNSFAATSTVPVAALPQNFSVFSQQHRAPKAFAAAFHPQNTSYLNQFKSDANLSAHHGRTMPQNNDFGQNNKVPLTSTQQPVDPPPSFINSYNNTNLNHTHLQARSSLPKELPNFSGLPEDWPLFSSTFEWSTNVCGFTDAENLIRLQKSLKGDALNHVQHILIHPSNVSWVMTILKLLYGQPEKIINSIKNRIKSTPCVDENYLPSFTTFALNVKSLIATIEATNLLNEINNSSLLQELLQKLPPAYQLRWAEQKLRMMNQNKNPNMYDFSNWIFDIGISASCITVENSSNYKREKNNTNNNNNKKAYINAHTADRKCFVCEDNNCKSIATCQKFISFNRGEKWSVIREHKLCKVCLFRHNSVCKKRVKCGIEGCEFFHHPLLHRYSEEDKDDKDSSNAVKTNTNSTEVVNTHSGASKQVLFKIMPVEVQGKTKVVNTYAFIDEGSSISLMDETLLEDLEVSGEVNPLCLKWTGGMERCENNSQKLTINISGENKKQIAINVNTVKSLSLPTQSLDYEMLSQRFPHLDNLPIKSYANVSPKILIGLNHFDLGMSTKARQGAPNEPVAVRTRLGWLIYGAVTANVDTSMHFNFHICDCSKDQQGLEELVKRFYSLDSVGVCCKEILVGKDDERALGLLKRHTRQRVCGHFESPLLWKFDVLNLPDSYDMAMKRLLCLERKLTKNNELLNVFRTTIEKYLQKGYIRKLNKGEINKNGKVWYLPIFAVFNKNKPGKSRVVWDAAAKTHGVSLNSFLLKGPDLLASLLAILFAFRERAVAVCGDIEEMFHQIYIRPEDRDVQRFLWRDCDHRKEPDVYVMDVMIFGATCAPSISQYMKNLNAERFEHQVPTAVRAIKENHYVDDLLCSVDTPQEAIKLIKDIKYVHRQGGFNMRNWLSNSRDVSNAIADSCFNNTKCLNLGEEKQVEKVLGVFWQHQEDIITFKISSRATDSDNFSGKKIPTKREMLRLVMSIYDPLGLIGNVIMYVKVLLQEVWRSKVDWDEEIPKSLVPKWNQWIQILPYIEHVKIPRCYLQTMVNYDNLVAQLHTFVDASKDGYAAVCYLRLVRNDTVICSLIGSKTRVAPIKMTSVPRLELMAALIGARFAKYIRENHKIEISNQFFWSDSKTVLSWISSDHRKYTQFVAFRVTEILDLTSIHDWRWTPTKQNVADEATKWARIPQICSSSRWFLGPEFLYQQEDNWPGYKIHVEETIEEKVHHIYKISSSEPLVVEARFSKWNRILRATAYVFRFITNCRTKIHYKGELSQEELIKAEICLFRQVQNEKYSTEISCLKLEKSILKSSEIYTKSPVLDQHGVLRVDGRIDNANIPSDQKRPIILPKSSYVTNLIILHYHDKYYHINHETVVNEIRQKYSISKLRAVVKSTIRKCQWCKIYKTVPQVPQMAKLPTARVAAYTAPFSYTGVDFFGPILVTVNLHREKRYGVLITCLTIRAVRIEIAHSLTTSSCILAVRNFMARRGIPLEFFSDNGTNFVGAERELREALADVDSDQLVKTFTRTTTKWNFNPPSAPHMGGAWERLVRSAKTVLYKIMPARVPSDELLRSMLVEVENIINSRPLAYVPVDDETNEALTPNHFLVGSSSGLKPMSSCTDRGLILNRNWLISQQYANNFWRRWLTEYLPTLTCRSKWFGKQKNLCPGDLVVIVDPSYPRNVWPRGKVLETRLAKDGQVRSAKVLTSNGILARPVAKLAILQVASQDEYADENPACHTAGENVATTGTIAG